MESVQGGQTLGPQNGSVAHAVDKGG